MSLGGPRHVARVWCLGRVPKHRNQWQEVEGLLFSPQNSQLVHILIFHSKAMVSLFIFPTGPTALDSEPRGRNTSKIWYTTGTVFIQGPSILLLVWGSIMFNDSYLRACMKLLFVKKIRFCLYSRAIDSEPRGRRYVKNTGHNRNCLYSRAIHCLASMEKHYVQWFLLRSV